MSEAIRVLEERLAAIEVRRKALQEELLDLEALAGALGVVLKDQRSTQAVLRIESQVKQRPAPAASKQRGRISEQVYLALIDIGEGNVQAVANKLPDLAVGQVMSVLTKGVEKHKIMVVGGSKGSRTNPQIYRAVRL